MHLATPPDRKSKLDCLYLSAVQPGSMYSRVTRCYVCSRLLYKQVHVVDYANIVAHEGPFGMLVSHTPTRKLCPLCSSRLELRERPLASWRSSLVPSALLLPWSSMLLGVYRGCDHLHTEVHDHARSSFLRIPKVVLHLRATICAE